MDIVSKKPIQNYVFGALLVLLFLMVCRLFAPFFTVLLWSVLLYIMMSPLYKRLIKKINGTTLKGKILRSIWASVFALGTLILILIPLSFMVFQFFNQIVDLIRYAQYTFYAKPGMIHDIFESIAGFVSDISAAQIRISADEIQAKVLQLLSSGMQGAVQFSSGLAKNISSFLFTMVMMFFCLYFFYIDGSTLSGLLKHTIPIRKEYMETLVLKFSEITKNLFMGYIAVAIIQSVSAGIIFTIFNIKGALVFAALVFICSFIPVIGCGTVWWPLGLVFLLNGEIVRGIVFLLVSMFFISIIDNFLRPIFLQDRIKLHPLVIFFAIMGGVRVLGLNGLILGPMIVILFLTVLDLFLTEHKIEEG
ncbi:MAG: AI-2E family transporter [Treponema sp.]|jgi:predicted PurR-regulated permease PerM|nr:AI-2E family transporter [Treponema sp.]